MNSSINQCTTNIAADTDDTTTRSSAIAPGTASESFAVTALEADAPAIDSSRRPPELIDDGEEPVLSSGMAEAMLVDAKCAAAAQHSNRGNDAGSGVELIEDDDGPPVTSAAMLEESFGSGDLKKPRAVMKTSASKYIRQQTRAGPETIQDNIGPDPPFFMMAFSARTLCESKKMQPLQIEPNIERPPRPSNAFDFDNDDVRVKHEDSQIKPNGESPPQNPDQLCLYCAQPLTCLHCAQPITAAEFDNIDVSVRRTDSLVIPAREDTGHYEVSPNTSRNGDGASLPVDNVFNALDANVGTSYPNAQRGEDEEVNVENTNPGYAVDMTGLGLEYRVPEAVLVEDGNDEVFLATHLEPPLPWWQQKQAKVFFTLICIVLIATVIAFGYALSQSQGKNIGPSNLITCEPKISSNAQKIDLPIDNPQSIEVAVEGTDMVVVLQDGDTYSGNSVFVMFYSLKAGVWQRANAIQVDDVGSRYDVSLSGKTAFVGFKDYESTGIVHIFEQNQFDDWQQLDGLSTAPTSAFGWSVGIDRDLAFVAESNRVTSFQRGSNGWVELDSVELYGTAVSISGDTIAIAAQTSLGSDDYHIHLYKSMPDLTLTPIQDPIPTGEVHSMDLSHEYLVYRDAHEEDAFIYRREGENQTFVFQEQLEIIHPIIPTRNEVTLDNNILVVLGSNTTHIFLEQNDTWEEIFTLALDHRDDYVYYEISGRQLFAISENEVHSFDIDVCSQEMPNQTPSASSIIESDENFL